MTRKQLAQSVAVFIAASANTALLAQEATETLVLEEVIVTAQRRAESLQEVNMTVTAITPQEVQDYNLFRFDDLEQLSPGLSLESNGGFGSTAQLRGVGFDSNSSASPAVDIYYNETPLDANFAFQSMYDIGQVEVLRGPQGTLRGRPSPGGAITLTTHRPDLSGWSGYVSGSAGDEGTRNVQGAVNIPIIENRLAARIAGTWDEDEGNRVRSVNSGAESSRETNSWRGSLSWMITDNLEATLTHQWLESDRVNMTEVEGPGAGYNGPAIGRRKGLSVMEDETAGTIESEITNLSVLWDLGAHRLIYQGAYQDNAYEIDSELDIYNAVTNFLEAQNVPTTYEVTSHELRLESTGDQFLDYVVGLWYYENNISAGFSQPAALPGAFGNPLEPSPIGPPGSDFILTASGDIPVDTEDKAIYGNFVFHLSEYTDISIGLRYLETDVKRVETVNTSAASTVFDVATAAGLPPGTPLGFCDLVLPIPPFTGEEPWPGYCELVVDASSSVIPGSSSYDEWVYGAAIKHFFSPEVMAYFRYDHSFRPPGVTVGLTAPVTDPALISGDPEESDSIEAGLRSDLLDGRMRLNASVFYQDFDNFVGRFNDLPYVGAGDTIQAGGFTYPGDATVQGAEIDLTGQISERWWAQLTIAYSKGEYDDADVPCRDTNGDGQPDNGDIGNLTLEDFNGETVIYCTVDHAISSIPNWVTVIQTEYSFPLFSNDAYVRALYNYYGDQDNLGSQYEADAYGVLNVYAGLRSSSSSWEFGLWIRNLLDEDTQVSGGTPQTVYGSFSPNYYQAGYVPGREVGLTLRYAFGEG